MTQKKFNEIIFENYEEEDFEKLEAQMDAKKQDADDLANIQKCEDWYNDEANRWH